LYTGVAFCGIGNNSLESADVKRGTAAAILPTPDDNSSQPISNNSCYERQTAASAAIALAKYDNKQHD
jgi:hypothetical protein